MVGAGGSAITAGSGREAARSVTKVSDPRLGRATDLHHPCNGRVTELMLSRAAPGCAAHYPPGASTDAKPIRKVIRAWTLSQTVFTRDRPKKLLVAKRMLEIPIIYSQRAFQRIITRIIHGTPTALYEFCHNRRDFREKPTRDPKCLRPRPLVFSPSCMREPLVLHDTGILSASSPTL